jgi:hypothetical protein
MRVLFFFCDRFAWSPSIKTLEEAPDAVPEDHAQAVVAFVHVEPQDVVQGAGTETKLVKNAKWLARKWDTKHVILHSFTHLGEDKADSAEAWLLLERAQKRLLAAGYDAVSTPYGYFNDLSMEAPGHPLARIYKQF